jgi:hypothetical protein
MGQAMKYSYAELSKHDRKQVIDWLVEHLGMEIHIEETKWIPKLQLKDKESGYVIHEKVSLS